jgi:hypothetical protein
MKLKLKWKIGIGILVLFIILISVSLFFMPGSYRETSSIEAPPSITPHIVDRLLDKMEFGSIAFNAPSNINIKDSPQIQLILSLSETIDELKQSITEEGEKIGTTIRVSDRMEARLSGYMFQITAII